MDSLFRIILKGIFKAVVIAIKTVCVTLWHGLKTVFTSPRKITILVIGTGLLYGVKCFLPILSTIPNRVAWLICSESWTIYPFIFVFANAGISRKIRQAWLQRKYEKIFLRIKFVSPDNFYPGYMGIRETGNMKVITFYSTIPLSTWVHKQDLLESAFNTRFYEITARPQNNRLIDIFILTKELPSVIPWSDAYILGGDTLFIGEGYHGRVGMNLEKQPHAFIAGETGSGKSIILQCMIYQALKKGYQVSLIDFKRGVSFSGFSWLVDIVVELEQANKLLSCLIQEVNKRLDLFVAEGVQDIKGYNQKMKKTGNKPLQRHIIVVDELAELVDTGGANKEEKAMIQAVNRNLRTLARIARAPGVHLLLGIQRPDGKIIDGQIKSNIPFRVCGHYADSPSSIIVLGNSKATRLPNVPGRFIVDNQEIQAYYFKLVPEQLASLCPTHKKAGSTSPPKPANKLQEAETPQIAKNPVSEKVETEKLDLDFSEL